MFDSIINYFTSLNAMGQALFIVGTLLVITFVILLIVVLKPEKKPNKIYGENRLTDIENQFEEKMKDINNISLNDINLDNDKTKNLKTIVDELRELETRSSSALNEIEKYELEQENTAIISVNELLKATRSFDVTNNEITNIRRETTVREEYLYNDSKPIENETRIVEEKQVRETVPASNTVPRQEVFSSVFANTEENSSEEDKEKFLNSLKEFRNNL